MTDAKILVVDDEEEICSLTRRFLSKRNHNIFTAYNVSQAIGLLQKERPKLVLLDIRLGDESGMDVLRLAKQIDKDVKVVMVTALNDEGLMKQAQVLGADDYITKPFTIAYLNEVVARELEGVESNDKT